MAIGLTSRQLTLLYNGSVKRAGLLPDASEKARFIEQLDALGMDNPVLTDDDWRTLALYTLLKMHIIQRH
jgi:hypothetical protein